MREVGGTFYPLSFWADNVEVFLVAAILAIGIRAFFLQPFKIPTNSMYPTYAGMVTKIHKTPADMPDIQQQAISKFLTFSSNYTIIAPADGQLIIPIVGKSIESENVRSMLIFTDKRYYLKVGNEKVSIDMPAQFAFESFFMDQFPAVARIESNSSGKSVELATGKYFKKGDTILSFTIETGDMLFVDRFSYNFLPPKVGDPFVFKTQDVPGLKLREEDTYYIKRLVGQGGDTLEVKNYGLYRNGQPITGVPAFARNAAREGDYGGYSAISVRKGEHSGNPLPDSKIPERHYFAMGDNSYNSSDGRVWGYVPEKAVVGKACFIFYPFTHRWGIAE